MFFKRFELQPQSDYFKQYGPMPITFEERGAVSGPVPEYNSEWDTLTRLTWEAGVLKARTGIAVYVSRAQYYSGGRLMPDFYSLDYPSGSLGPLTDKQAHEVINGINIGYRIAKSENFAEER